MFKRLKSTGIFGMDPYMVDVEIDMTGGFPAFDIVGLPDLSVKESRDRVRSVFKNCEYKFPSAKIVINLAPADVKKVGSLYDFPVFLAIMFASGAIKTNFPLEDTCFIGELSLDGNLRSVNGVLAMVIGAREKGIKRFFLPYQNAAEASVVEGIEIFPVKNVVEAVSHINGEKQISPKKPKQVEKVANYEMLDFAQVMGQKVAKHALEIAAAGGHNVLMIGPPGSGKSMLAKRLPSILPPMSFEESIETTKVYSVSGMIDSDNPLVSVRPFRSPHHTVSAAGLTGGGVVPKPGEISLSHNGVLFLDELPEFSKQVMEVLRAPVEDREVTISRASGRVTYPCNFTLIGAMNPCPCGYFGHPTKKCICSTQAVKKYLGRISGPMLDRLDIHVEVPAVKYSELTSKVAEESSEQILKRVEAARQIQLKRYKDSGIRYNSELTPNMVKKYCVMTKSAENMMEQAFARLSMSARSYDRLIKVARTIADLEGDKLIDVAHISRALQFRDFDSKYKSSL